MLRFVASLILMGALIAPINAQVAPTTIITLSVARSAIAIVITWSTRNATSCAASDGWGGAAALNGTLTLAPLSTTPYTLTCIGPGGISSITMSGSI